MSPKTARVIRALIEGKAPKQLAAELGVTRQAITDHVSRYRREAGCRTIYQAIAKFVLSKPPEGVD